MKAMNANKSHVFTLIMILFFSGCAGIKYGPKIKDTKDDVLSEESFIRYTNERIENLPEKSSFNQSKKCHMGDISEGLEELKETFELNKDRPDYWNQLGTCFFLDENYTLATMYYKLSLEKAYKLEKTSQKHKKRQQKLELSKNKNHFLAIAYNNLGVVLTYQGKFSQGLEHFQKARKKAPQFLTPQFNEGQLFLKFGLLDKAKERFYKLFHKSKTDVDILAGLGTIYMMKGRYKKALTFFSMIPPNFWGRPDIGINFAYTLLLQKNLEKARDVLDSVKVKKGFKEYAQKIRHHLDAKIAQKEALEEGQEKASQKRVLSEKGKKKKGKEKKVNLTGL